MKGRIFKANITPAAKDSNTNILAASLTAANDLAVFRVWVNLNADGKFGYTIDGGDLQILNNDTALKADNVYYFDVAVDQDEEINFQHQAGAGVIVNQLKVREITEN